MRSLDSHRQSSRFLLIAGVALALLFPIGCSVVTGRSDRGGSSRRDQGSTLEWRKCSIAPDAQCATLSVPLDWSDPEGTKIDLALGRIQARGSYGGSLLMNPGGPGGSGLELLAQHPTTEAIAKRFDRVSWDPRGVGRSGDIACGSGVSDMLSEDQDPDTSEEQAALDEAARSVADDCAASDPALLRHMQTEDTARDLEAVRVALGGEPLNYLGFSYGTHIGQAYAALFPEHVSKMVLDGLVDPADTFTEFLLAQTAAFDAAFDRQTSKCTASGVSVCGVKDLGAAFDKVKEAAEQQPIPAGDSWVGPGEVAMAAITTTYRPDGWHELGSALSEAIDGDATSLKSISDRYQDMASYGAYAAVICSDGPTPRGAKAYRAFADQARVVSPRFGGAAANELLPCASWPIDTPAPPRLEIAGVAPILLIANSGDPATPIDNARRVNARIKGSVLVTVDSDGHTSFGSNICVDKLVDDYLLRSKLPGGESAKCR